MCSTISFLPKDEGALIEAARDLGFKFNVRTPDYVEINVVGL